MDAGGDVAAKIVVDPYRLTGETNFTNNSGSISFFVQPKGKHDTTISFCDLPAWISGGPPLNVNAAAPSGLPMSSASTTVTVCTVNGNLVTLVAAGIEQSWRRSRVMPPMTPSERQSHLHCACAG